MGGTPTLVGILASIITVLAGIIAYGLRKLVIGDLVTRTSMERENKSFEARLAREKEIADLQAATQVNLVTVINKQTAQLEALVSEQRTTREVMTALKTASELAASSALGRL